jgi:hypothetical protein
MVLVFILIDIEKTFGPKYLMPLIRNAGFCLKTPEDDSFKAQDGQLWHIATSASTTGMPITSRRVSTSVSRRTSQDQIGHGLSHPVAQHRPEDILALRRTSQGQIGHGLSHPVAQHRPEDILALSRDKLHRASQISVGYA